MLFAFSEPLALIPYLLRAMRIKKIFEARDIYYESDKMPKKMIAKWKENVLIGILLAYLSVYAFVGMTYSFINFWFCREHDDDSTFFCKSLPNFNTVSQPMNDNG